MTAALYRTSSPRRQEIDDVLAQHVETVAVVEGVHGGGGQLRQWAALIGAPDCGPRAVALAKARAVPLAA